MIGRRELLKQLAKASGALLTGCAGLTERTPSLLDQLRDREYDYSSVLASRETFEAIESCVYRVTVQDVYSVNNTDFRHAGVVKEGSAVAISENIYGGPFLLTSAHTLIPNIERETRDGAHEILERMRMNPQFERLARRLTPQEIVLTPKELETIVYIYPNGMDLETINSEELRTESLDNLNGIRCDIYAGNVSLDIAVIEAVPSVYEESRLGRYPTIGNDLIISDGHELYLNGFGGRRGSRLGRGIQSGSFDNGMHIYTASDASVDDGFSGGGVFALMDGNPELIGIIGNTDNSIYSGFIGLSRIRSWLEEINLGHLLPPSS